MLISHQQFPIGGFYKGIKMAVAAIVAAALVTSPVERQGSTIIPRTVSHLCFQIIFVKSPYPHTNSTTNIIYLILDSRATDHVCEYQGLFCNP